MAINRARKIEPMQVRYPQSPCRVMIVDDHPLMCQGLASLLAGEDDLVLCGQASGSSDALSELVRVEPDVVVVDLVLSDGSGLELIKQIRAIRPQARTLVFSVYNERVYAERALRAGAMGYVCKDEMIDQLLVAIRQVHEGRFYLSEEMSDLLLEELDQDEAYQSQQMIDRLSDRELQVFQLLGKGWGTRAIAEHLHLSVKTIETYRDQIKRKLNLTTSNDLVHFAIRWQIEHE